MTKLSALLLPTLQLVLSLVAVQEGSAFTVPTPLVHHPAHSRRVFATANRRRGVTGFGFLLQLTYNDEVNETIDDMVRSSNLAYTFATIRAIVKEYDLVEGLPKKGKGVNFNTPALVITQGGAQPVDQNRLFRYPITAAAIERFLELNRHLLKQGPTGGDVSFDDTNKAIAPNDLPRMPIEAIMTDFRMSVDGEFLDYDDKDTTSAGLVYSLFKSRTKKRFTVAFRGTVGPKDILTDAKFAFKTTPEPLKGDDIKLHRGFASYLFNDREEPLDDGTLRKRTRFDRILAAVKECYEELPADERDEWDLCVTGHSLGGGLANIFAYSVAQTQRDVSYLNRVTAITIAAPVVGNYGYNTAHQGLEREGRLRHIRISNEGDVVPSKPYPGYTQNGVNLHLFDDKMMELNYRNTKNVITQINLKMLDKHMFPEYTKRLALPYNKEILSKKISDLYEVAGDFTN